MVFWEYVRALLCECVCASVQVEGHAIAVAWSTWCDMDIDIEVCSMSMDEDHELVNYAVKLFHSPSLSFTTLPCMMEKYQPMQFLVNCVVFGKSKLWKIRYIARILIPGVWCQKCFWALRVNNCFWNLYFRRIFTVIYGDKLVMRYIGTVVEFVLNKMECE